MTAATQMASKQSRFTSSLLDWSDQNTTSDHDGSFDVLLASDVFYDLPSRELLAKRMAGMLKRDGTLLVALPLESEYRPGDQASPEAAAACLGVLEREGFEVESTLEVRGAQLPGEGPEGLAETRRCMIATLAFK